MQPNASLIVAVLIAAATFTAAQAVWGMVRVAKAKRTVNNRLKAADRVGSLADLVVELRKQRGLTESGERRLGWRWLGELVTRSGVVFEPRRWILTILCVGMGSTTAGMLLSHNLLVGAAIGVVGAVALPIGFLQFKAARRAKALAEQLPQALQIIVRSLEAGHPVPTAIALVGREMPDPIGSEFGLAADEIAYGATLAQAVARIADRCRHADVDLFASVIRLQERSGGNLVGLLKMIARTIRERLKMRMKVKALSSEGKASAMILIGAPFATAGILQVLSPDFYGEVIGEPIVAIVLSCLAVWMTIGALVMRKMINMKI
jgi:tight adherence protein B